MRNIVAGVICLLAFIIAGVFGLPQALGLLGVGIGVALVGNLPDPWKKIAVGVLVGWGLLTVVVPVTWNLIMGRFLFSSRAWEVRHVIEDIRGSERIRVHGAHDIRVLREFADRIEAIEGRRLADEYRRVLKNYEAGRINFDQMMVYDQNLRDRIRLRQSWRKEASDFLLEDEYAPPPTRPWYERLWSVAPRVLMWTLGVAAIVGLILGIVLKRPQLASASLVGAVLVAALFVADARFFRGGGNGTSFPRPVSSTNPQRRSSGDVFDVSIGTEWTEVKFRDHGVPDNTPVNFYPQEGKILNLRFREVCYRSVGRTGKWERQDGKSWTPVLRIPSLAPDPVYFRVDRPANATPGWQPTMTVKLF